MDTTVTYGSNLPITIYLDDPQATIPGPVIEQCAKVFRVHAPCPDGRVAEITGKIVGAFLSHPDSRYNSGLHEQIEAQADELSTLASCIEELRAENKRLHLQIQYSH